MNNLLNWYPWKNNAGHCCSDRCPVLVVNTWRTYQITRHSRLSLLTFANVITRPRLRTGVQNSTARRVPMVVALGIVLGNS